MAPRSESIGGAASRLARPSPAPRRRPAAAAFAGEIDLDSLAAAARAVRAAAEAAAEADAAPADAASVTGGGERKAARARAAAAAPASAPAGDGAGGMGPPPSRAARRAAALVLASLYLAWFAALLAGSLAYEGEPVRAKPAALPLARFDAAFRRGGALLVPALWAARGALAPPAAPAARAAPLLAPGALYGLQGALRSAVLALHRRGLVFGSPRWALWPAADAAARAAGHPPHVMSDHILLAGAALAGLAAEAALAPLTAAALGGGAGRRAAGAAVGAAATALAAAVAGECYYTARHFHPPGEILSAAAVGNL